MIVRIPPPPRVRRGGIPYFIQNILYIPFYTVFRAQTQRILSADKLYECG